MECKNLIESGTIDLQKGCPLCGGKKFQFIRARPSPDAKPTVSEYVASAELREPQLEAKESPISRYPERTSSGTSSGTSPSAYPSTSPGAYPAVRPIKELAQAKMSEQKPAKKQPPADKLGDRIESVRIVEHGTYDINLPLLLSRKELVTSKEEGNYTLDLNSALKPGKKKKHK
jgi:predicted  nucleic acid-binding Zn-ribbon protein